MQKFLNKARDTWRGLESKSALLIALIISIAPLWRGLFFQADQLVFSIPLFLIGIVWFWRMRQNPQMEKLDWAVLALSLLYVLSNAVAQNRYQALCWALQMAAMALIYFILSRELTDRPRVLHTVLHMMTLMNVAVALDGLLAYTGLVWGLTDAVLSDRLTATFQYPNTAAAFFNTGMILCLLLAELVDKHWLKALYSGLYVLEVMAFFLCRSRIAFMQLAVVMLGFFLLVPWKNKLRVVFVGGINTIIGMLVTNRLQELFQRAVEANEIWNQSMGLGIRLHWGPIGGEAVLWSVIACVAGAILSLVAEPLLVKLEKRTPSLPTQRKITYSFLAFTFVVGLLIVSSLFVPAVSSAMRFVLEPFLPADLTNAITNISLSDPNFTGRIMFIENALGIAKDYPLLGTGGGGYASVYSRYQPVFATSRFTHSQPFQVLSETGIGGFVAYLAIWGFGSWLALKILWKSFNSEKEDPRHLLLGGLLPAVWAIGAHSTFDFDLTYVAMQMWVYVLFALIAAVAWTGENRRPTHDDAALVKGRRRRSGSNVPMLSYIIPIALSIMLAANVPMVVSEQIVEGITAETNIQKIIDAYDNAIKWVNFNSNMLQRYARFRIDLIQRTNNVDQQRAHLQRAYEVAELAVANDKLNPDTIYSLQLCYYYASEYAKSVAGAQELYAASPYWPSGLTLAATSFSRSLFHYTEQGQTQEIQRIVNLISDWEELLPGHDDLPTPQMALTMGQASVIQGKYEQALHYIDLASGHEDTWRGAAMLLAGVYQRQGGTAAAEQILSMSEMEGVRASNEYKAILGW